MTTELSPQDTLLRLGGRCDESTRRYYDHLLRWCPNCCHGRQCKVAEMLARESYQAFLDWDQLDTQLMDEQMRENEGVR